MLISLWFVAGIAADLGSPNDLSGAVMLDDTYGGEDLQPRGGLSTAPESLRLLVVAGDGAGTVHNPIKPLRVGRAPSCEICFSHRRVSRLHAVIVNTGRGWLEVADSNSRHGTFVNGHAIKVKEIELGDVVQVGPCSLLVTSANTFSERLRHTQRLALVGRMAGASLHDFNNELTAISANLEYLDARAGLASPFDECLDDVRASCNRAIALAGQLLGHSRAELPMTEVDLPELASEVARLARRSLPPEVTLTVETRDSVVVKGVRSQLWQVLLNLVLNAVDALPDTGGTITIDIRRHRSTQSRDLSGGFAIVQVIDDGCGFAAGVAERAFEPFFTTKPECKGTGLGLAMAREIVTEHGGSLSIESTKGKGATVKICLPLATRRRGALKTDDFAWDYPGMGKPDDGRGSS